jgi:hypothetical protein
VARFLYIFEQTSQVTEPEEFSLDEYCHLGVALKSGPIISDESPALSLFVVDMPEKNILFSQKKYNNLGQPTPNARFKREFFPVQSDTG